MGKPHFSLSLREISRERDDAIEPHPILAPIAWIACFLSGTAFWLMVFRVIA
jgi:hypothetical protein